MNADTFLENFEILAEAQGGIDRLRELILSLAVRGKLVAQDPHEPTIFDELGDINRNEVGEMLSSERQLETRLPSNWVYAGFRHIGRWVGGNGFPTDKQGGRNKEILFCKVSDMNLEPNSKYIFETVNSLDLTTAKEMRVTPHAVGTVIFPKIGGAIATNKRRLLVKPTVIDNNCMGVSPSSVINPEWLYVLFRSIDLTKYQSGTSIPSISQRVLDEIRFGVPPRAEQKRIVTKVDELMALCDQLEQQQQQRDNLRTATRKSAIDAISTATRPEELEAAWKRINNNWEVIADTPESIDSLRELILDLAVRGDLGITDISDAKAPTLWDVEEQRLDVDKLWKLDTMHVNPANGWSRLPLARLGTWGSGGTPTASRKEFYNNGSIPWAVIGDLNNGIMTDTSSKITQKALTSSSAKLIPKNAVLIAMYGASIGKTAVTGIECTTNQAIAHCIVDESVLSTEYFFLVAKSLKKHLIKVGKGAAQPNISQTVLKHLLIDVPQLNAQQIVVSKVNDFMALCDQLESELKARGEVGEKFARSVVNAA